MKNIQYHCPRCGTVLYYEGLCWKCRAQVEREEVQSWNLRKIQEVQARVLEHIAEIQDWEKPIQEDFWRLLTIHHAITPAIQRKAVVLQIYEPCEIYYHAPADVRDQLIHALEQTESSREGSNLMACLAMQGDDTSLQVLHSLEQAPRSWQKYLYAGAAEYAQCGGWTFDEQGSRQSLLFNHCFALEKGDRHVDKAITLGRIRKDVCPHCKGPMVDILVVDGRDPRLSFLGLDGILTATCCPNCVGFTEEPMMNHFRLDGHSEVLPYKITSGISIQCYISPQEYEALENNHFVLSQKEVPLFYGAHADDVNTIGGFANWVQDYAFVRCPHCGKPMKYLAQIHWDTLFDGTEGTLYIEYCPDCQIVAMQHQQT